MSGKKKLIFLTGTLLFSLLALSVTPVTAEENKKYAVVSKKRKAQITKNIEDNLHTLKTLRADFIQERHIALFLDVLKSGGLLSFERPGKLRWELTEPYRTIMLFNDNKVAKFRIEKGKIEKAGLGMEDLLRGVLGQIISILKGDFSKSMKAYNMEVFEGENYLLKLTPKSEKMAKTINSLELFFDIESLNMSQIIIREPQNDFMKITFSNQRINETLKARLFNLESPEF
ncbi:MAG: outer membrane lipoprotein carrier protein LolA [Deltaproteobacteria bacterium]|nr:outer membrane lipoprotein carrier protein LolA [Deltaproteobacteria bacterium]